jgi:branched-chain amino acid transport system ATP-binding protein
VREIFEIIKRINERSGRSCWSAERPRGAVDRALHYHGNGKIVLDDTVEKLRTDIKEFYLGLAGRRQEKLRDVKHYRRRKRWLS